MSAPYTVPPPPLKAAVAASGGLLGPEYTLWLNSLLSFLKAAVLQNPLTVTAAYMANPGDVVWCDTTAAGFTVTLPAASKAASKSIRVIKKSSDGNTLTVAAAGSDKINGAGTQTTAAQYGKFTLVPDNVSNWGLF